MKIYVDGVDQPLRVIIDHANNDIQSKESPLQVGHGLGVDERFTGLIDEVRIFDRVLSAEQVSVVSVRESLSELAGITPQKRSTAQSNKLRWAFRERFAPAQARTAWRQVEHLDLARERLIASFPTVMVMAYRSVPSTRIARSLARSSTSRTS